ncbi:phospholipase A [Marinicella pacifica]|nr:phospholipase A [Marinicella pacifica]
MKNIYIFCSLFMVLNLITMPVFAQETSSKAFDACVLKQFSEAREDLTIAEIKSLCNQQPDDMEPEINQSDNDEDLGVISQRLEKERKTRDNPFVLTPHKMNYILPVYTTNAINKKEYQFFEGYEENLEDMEAMFQISYKVPLNQKDMFVENDALYLGFTLKAWWQVYAENISKPFRETNYNPELFYLMPMKWQILNGNTAMVFGIEHESNGRTQALSRSWNRVYANFLYEHDNFALSLKPWIRLSEREKEFDLDPGGDDNPDIEDYMGHFELNMAYKWRHFELNFKGRRNFSTNKGYSELGFVFPLWGKLQGYAVASDGYGDSLIDYNYRQTRFGLGFSLNGLL